MFTKRKYKFRFWNFWARYYQKAKANSESDWWTEIIQKLISKLKVKILEKTKKIWCKNVAAVKLK